MPGNETLARQQQQYTEGIWKYWMKTLQKEEKTPHMLLCLTIRYILIPLHHIIVKTECAYAVNHILLEL